MSEAHVAIYEHISECRDEMVEELHRMQEEHLQIHHHPPVSQLAKQMGKTPTELMTDFIDVVVVSRRVVDALEGPEEIALDGTASRRKEGGLIHKVDVIGEDTAELKVELKNGVKHKLEISKLQYTLAGTTIITLGTIAVALFAN